MLRGALFAALAAVAALWIAGPAAAQDRPELSLVTARATSSIYWPGLIDDPDCEGTCFNPWTLVAFDHATTLAGPPMPEAFYAQLRLRLPIREPIPALLAVAQLKDGGFQVYASEGGDTACFAREMLAKYDWNPAGPGIVAKDGGVCVDLTGLDGLSWKRPRYTGPLPATDVRAFRRAVAVRPAWSLVTGYWGPSAVANENPCPDAGEDDLCMDVVEDVALRDMQTLVGPEVRGKLRFRLHAPPRRGRKLVLLVQPFERGRPRRAVWLETAVSGESACIDRSWFTDNGMPYPEASRQRGSDVCFRI
jgi:hypothetical protein